MFGYFFPKNFSFTLPEKVEPKKRREPDGMICLRCKEFFHMAEPNQEDETFRCYSCRKNPYR